MKNPIIVAELKRIAAENGGTLKPVDVVEAARPEESPLHSQFEWNDDEAAEQWRLHQARNLINVVVSVVFPPGSREPREHSTFVSLSTDRHKGGAGYRVMTEVLSDEQHRAQLLADAKRDMIGFKSRYRELSELADVFSAIDRAVEEREAVAV